MTVKQQLLLSAKLQLRKFALYRRVLRVQAQIGSTLRRTIFAVARWLTSRTASFGPPNGLFSLTDGVRHGDPENGGIILESQGVPPTPPDSLMILSGLGQHERQPWPIIWSHRYRARLCSRSLALLNEKKQIAAESIYGADFGREDPAQSYFIRGTPLRLVGNWTSIVSRWVPTHAPTNYAHWLLEALPRLAVLDRFPPDMRIIVPSHLQVWQETSLRWLGLLDRCRRTSETYIELENYYFSGAPTMIVCYSPYSVNFLRTHLLPHGSSTTQTPKRFFLKRSGQLRSLVNAGEVEAFFQKAGWDVVDTGAMRLEEQIALFRNAEVIVAVHGAGVANIVWASPGCKLLELVPENYLNGCYEWMAYVLGVEYRYELCRADNSLNAYVDLNHVRRILTGWGVM